MRLQNWKCLSHWDILQVPFHCLKIIFWMGFCFGRLNEIFGILFDNMRYNRDHLTTGSQQLWRLSRRSCSYLLSHVHTCYHIVVIAVWVLEVDVWGAGAKMVLEVSLSCFIYHPRRNLCSVFSNPSGPTAVVVFIVQQTKKVISNCFYSCHIKSHWPTLM